MEFGFFLWYWGFTLSFSRGRAVEVYKSIRNVSLVSAQILA
jgi:hypothetical protein